MSAIQTFCQVEFDDKESINFMPHEWEIFKNELERQVAKDEALDFLEAVRVARLYAKNESKSKPAE